MASDGYHEVALRGKVPGVKILKALRSTRA
jgi:hypothetical protein